MAFSVAIAFSFAAAMVVSCLPACCCVDDSASRPLNSASDATSAYQLPIATCPLAPLFPFAFVCWLVVPSPLISPLHHLSLHSCLSRPSSTPPLCLRRLVVASNLAAPPTPLDAPLAHVLPLAAPPPHIRQLALSCTAIFMAPSIDAAAIVGILKCTAHPPGGGITNGHCPLSFGSRPPTVRLRRRMVLFAFAN